MSSTGSFSPNADGVLLPARTVTHRHEEYDEAGFDLLADMQARHFWYLGRHRFLHCALKDALRRAGLKPGALAGVDLGGGCGGWVRYLNERWPGAFAKLALADSSPRALALAAGVVGPNIERYQVDLLDLPWEGRWDVAFLLDVLEHIPDDRRVLGQVRRSLHPKGLLLVTAPALRVFWTYNDVLAHHLRRYSRRDLARLAEECGLEVCFTRYFQFFLSPLLLLSRLKAPDIASMTDVEIQDHLKRTHQVPPWPANQVLRLFFSLETPLGLRFPFPWGTSVLAVLQRRN
jgi:SAM-dependent methyltransferase